MSISPFNEHFHSRAERERTSSTRVLSQRRQKKRRTTDGCDVVTRRVTNFCACPPDLNPILAGTDGRQSAKKCSGNVIETETCACARLAKPRVKEAERNRRRARYARTRDASLCRNVINMTNYVLHIWRTATTKNQAPFFCRTGVRQRDALSFRQLST